MFKYFAVVGIVLVSAFGAYADVVLKNVSDYRITEIYVSPAKNQDWGDDLLKNKELLPNQMFTVTGVKPGKWDFRLAIVKNGEKKARNCDIREVKIGKEGDVSEFDSETLNGCAEATAAIAEQDESEDEE